VSIGGLGTGALLAGVLAQFAGAPLRLTFWVHLVLVAVAAVLVWAMPEPVEAKEHVRLRPQRLDVPPEVRAVFVPAAMAAFAGFAVLGLFTAVAPGFLSEILNHRSHATAGLVVFVVFAASALGQSALAPVAGAAALPAGCVGLLVGMGLVALGLAVSSLALLVVGGVVSGLGQGVSFRAGLTAVNERTPPDRRAEVASSFFVVAYVAISVPVVGVGVAAQLADLRTAGLIFAAVVGALVLTVLVLLSRGATEADPAVGRAASR
jgi:MFS family permease